MMFLRHLTKFLGPDCIGDKTYIFTIQVYAGLSEFSFEELRAMKWKQDQEKRRLEKGTGITS